MKNNVLDFIESKTLRQHLSGQVLAPAVECILIAQCRCRSLEDKLKALEERYETYSTEDFKKGAYNSFANDFKNALYKYINYKQLLLNDFENTDGDKVFVISADEYVVEGTVYRSLDKAIKIAREKLQDECCSIVKRSIDGLFDDITFIKLDEEKVITDVSYYRYQDAEYNVQNAYAEIPHQYKIGDIVKSGDEYAVVADVKHNMVLPEYMKHSDYTDMCLYCLGYYKDQLHSCKGAFGHLHFPILKTELCPEEELPESKKELIILSRLLKGEIRIADFLEMYSNGEIRELLR